MNSIDAAFEIAMLVDSATSLRRAGQQCCELAIIFCSGAVLSVISHLLFETGGQPTVWILNIIGWAFLIASFCLLRSANKKLDQVGRLMALYPDLPKFLTVMRLDA
jgi:hypothetical protein